MSNTVSFWNKTAKTPISPPTKPHARPHGGGITGVYGICLAQRAKPVLIGGRMCDGTTATLHRQNHNPAQDYLLEHPQKHGRTSRSIHKLAVGSARLSSCRCEISTSTVAD